MNKEQMLEAIFKTAVENGYTDLKLDVLPVQTAELLVGSGYTVVGLLFDHNFAKAVFGEVEMFAGGITVDEWRADWKANYFFNKNRTEAEAKKIMQSDLDYFRKEGSILPAYLMKLSKLAAVVPEERLVWVYENMRKG